MNETNIDLWFAMRDFLVQDVKLEWNHEGFHDLPVPILKRCKKWAPGWHGHPASRVSRRNMQKAKKKKGMLTFGCFEKISAKTDNKNIPPDLIFKPSFFRGYVSVCRVYVFDATRYWELGHHHHRGIHRHDDAPRKKWHAIVTWWYYRWITLATKVLAESSRKLSIVPAIPTTRK